LVIAGTCFEEKDLDKLRRWGVKDSKLLSVAQRERFYDKIIKFAKSHKVVIVDNKEIDSRSTVGLNLNELEALKIANIVEELLPNQVIVDSPHPIAEKFESAVLKFVKPENKGKFKIISEHKADFKYVECAAASILAKVTRDREIEKIKEQIGIDFGSGYSSDERTIEALEQYHDGKLNAFIRKSWATYKNIISKKDQTSLEEFNSE
jgi:ribonuclease HII